MAVRELMCVLCLTVLSNAFLLPQVTERRVTQILTVDNGQVWGKFGAPELCINGSYATGFYIKLQEPNTDHDETGVNGIGLSCTMPDDQSDVYNNVTSAVSEWGTWGPETTCPNGQVLMRFQIKVQKGQLAGDDTAVDGVRFRCRMPGGGTETDLDGGREAPYGDWGEPSTYCPLGSGICGLSTSVEGKQDIGSVLKFDDTALNDVMFYCCDD